MINWHVYNESLVRRREIIVDFDVLDKWNNELKNMNEGKEGASYFFNSSPSKYKVGVYLSKEIALLFYVVCSNQSAMYMRSSFLL